jgi:hypothetical protein
MDTGVIKQAGVWWRAGRGGVLTGGSASQPGWTPWCRPSEPTSFQDSGPACRGQAQLPGQSLPRGMLSQRCRHLSTLRLSDSCTSTRKTCADSLGVRATHREWEVSRGSSSRTRCSRRAWCTRAMLNRPFRRRIDRCVRGVETAARDVLNFMCSCSSARTTCVLKESSVAAGGRRISSTSRPARIL